MLTYVTYYVIDRPSRKVLFKSLDPAVTRAYYDASKLIRQVYLISIISNGIPPANETA